MNEIQLRINDNGRGAFFMEREGKQVAEMEILVKDGNLTVFHTEVDNTLKGKGVAATLLSTMTAYAREHKLRVIPLCPYVLAQFKRHQELYADIWNKSWHA
jgi:predicted GNAT family acetyltransferase